MSELFALTLVGLVTGAVYAVAASGLVVTYTTSNIFNIAHGAIGMVMAFAYWEVRHNQGWPTWLSLLFVVGVLAPAFGALIERVLIRRLHGSSVTVTIVVTLGLMLLLIGVGQSIWPPTARSVPGFFSPGGIDMGGVVFVSWHQLITIIVAIVVAAVLYVLLKRTRVGVAMRATVDDRTLLSLMGGTPERMSMLSWALGSMLAAVAGILLAPALSLDHLILTLLVINAYAAAVVGKLRNLPLTFAGAVALGIVESYVVGYQRFLGPLGDVAGFRLALPTIFLFLALLVLPEVRLRVGRVVGATVPRIPSLRASLIGSAALIVSVLVVSGFVERSTQARIGQGLALAFIMLTLVLLTGYGGQVSLCQLTFAGVGAFVVSQVGANLLGFGLALLAATFVGALIALPALRLEGLYLALATMAFASFMDRLFFENPLIFGYGDSVAVGRLSIGPLGFDSDRAYIVLLAVMFSAVGMLVLAIRRGRLGRLLAAMRDSPMACATLGLNLTRVKLLVFGLSAGLAGVGGALLSGLRGVAAPIEFNVLQSLPLLLLAVIGGITSVTGAFIGGMVYAFLPAIEQAIPALGGLVYLMIGVAAVSLGRNPNGVGFVVFRYARRLFSPLLPWIEGQPEPAPAGPRVVALDDETIELQPAEPVEAGR